MSPRTKAGGSRRDTSRALIAVKPDEAGERAVEAAFKKHFGTPE